MKPVQAANVTGFNSAEAKADQELVITVDGKTTTYKVQIVSTSDTSGLLEMKTTSAAVGPSKIWTIELSGLVDETSLKDQIYITNSEGIIQIPNCSVTAENGHSLIKVIPAQSYTPGDYILWVRGLKSSEGTKIKNQVYLKFSVK